MEHALEKQPSCKMGATQNSHYNKIQGGGQEMSRLIVIECELGGRSTKFI